MTSLRGLPEGEADGLRAGRRGNAGRSGRRPSAFRDVDWARELDSPWPFFMNWLDTDRERCMAGLYEFIWRLSVTFPPAVFLSRTDESREDIVSEAALHIMKDELDRLRAYDNRGAPFSFWVKRILERRAQDLIRIEQLARKKEHLFPRPRSASLEDRVEFGDYLDRVRECMAILSAKCRAYIESAADFGLEGYLRSFLGGENPGKRVSDTRTSCRKQLIRKMKEMGLQSVVQELVKKERERHDKR